MGYYLLARRFVISFHLHFLRLFDPALNDACLVMPRLCLVLWPVGRCLLCFYTDGKKGRILISDMNACNEMMGVTFI